MIKVIERDPEKLKPISFVKYSWLWFAISIVAILASIGFMVVNQNDAHIGTPLKLGIDYTGGTLLSGTTGQDVSADEVTKIVQKYSSAEPIVQVIRREGHTRDIEIRTSIKVDPSATREEQNDQRTDNLAQLKDELATSFSGFDLKNQDYVGPTVGRELIQNAIVALVLGSILILIYIFWRFGNLVFAFAAILALLHDVMITVGGVALLKIEVNSSFIAVILTIIGYSINATIITFDRVRENMNKYPALDFVKLADISLTQTIVRTIATVFTVVIILLSLIFFGGESIQPFVRAMLIGMIAGAYSSIFIATPLVLLFRAKEKTRIATSVGEAERIAVSMAEGESTSKQKSKHAAKPQPRPKVSAPVSNTEDTDLDETSDSVDDSDDTGEGAETGGQAGKRQLVKKKGKARRR